LVVKLGSIARPSRPRSQKFITLTRRSATTVGVVEVRVANFLMRPLFSITITLPSGRKRIVVGFTRPLKATCSLNPACLKSVAARVLVPTTRAAVSART